MAKYDVVIVGGGHNGLTAAAYLSRAGRKVLVLERRHLVGGAAVTEEVFPGFRFSVCSYVVSLLRPEIIRDLDLARHGLQLLPLDGTFTPLPDRDYLWRTDDHECTRRELARHSTRDARQYDDFNETMARIAQFVKPILEMTPPDPRRPGVRGALQLAGLARRYTRLAPGDQSRLIQMMTVSVVDFLKQWFETDALIATMAASGTIGTFLGVRSPGTAYVLLHHYMGEIDGVFRSWGLARGGTGSVSERHRRSSDGGRRRDSHQRAGRAHQDHQRSRGRGRTRERRDDRHAARRLERRSTRHVPSPARSGNASGPTSSRACATSDFAARRRRSIWRWTACRDSRRNRRGTPTCAGRSPSRQASITWSGRTTRRSTAASPVARTWTS